MPITRRAALLDALPVDRFASVEELMVTLYPTATWMRQPQIIRVMVSQLRAEGLAIEGRTKVGYRKVLENV